MELSSVVYSAVGVFFTSVSLAFGIGYIAYKWKHRYKFVMEEVKEKESVKEEGEESD